MNQPADKHRFHTIEEAAKISKIPATELFAVMYCNPGKPSGTNWLFPAVIIHEPLPVLRVWRTGRGLEPDSKNTEIVGIFETSDLPKFNNNTGYTEPIYSLIPHDCQGWYSIPNGRAFHKDDLRVSEDSLFHYMESERIPLPTTKATTNNKTKTRNPKDMTGHRNAKHTFMDDALSAYHASKGKYPNTVDYLMEFVQPGMENKVGDEKYCVIDVGKSSECYLTLKTKKGEEEFPYNKINRAFMARKKLAINNNTP